MSDPHVDVLIIGSGLGAAATAVQLSATSASIAMMEGAGRSRSTDVDGGVIAPSALAHAFGEYSDAPLHQFGELTVFRRSELEKWALEKLAGRVDQITGVEEAFVLPHDTGELTMKPANREETLRARLVILTEGANPKIGIAAKLRPDFDPPDMIHFGRTIVSDTDVTAYRSGSWRTSWGMPVGYQVIPQSGNQAIVAVSARIENIMRCGRNAKDALADLLKSDLAEELRVTGPHGVLTMELVPLLPTGAPDVFARGNLLISPDALGAIDAREISRWNDTIRAGAKIGSMIRAEWPQLNDWDDLEAAMKRVCRSRRSPYHDDKTTGYIEEGAGPKRGLLSRLFGR